MNIFVLNRDPVLAARDMCNSHVCKMVTETAQLLATCFPEGTLRFKHTHLHHPCVKWLRQSSGNYDWLLEHGLELSMEYTRRYGRVHASNDVIQRCIYLTPDVPNVGLTPFARAIKQPWKDITRRLDTVNAYRVYYVGDKSHFAKWAPHADPPTWWPFSEDKK